MTDIVKRLLALARAEHDDLAIADEAADEIERLREALKGAHVVVGIAEQARKEAEEKLAKYQAAMMPG